MPENNLQNENMLDQILRSNLRKYTEPIRPDFTDNILKQVEFLAKRKILAKIVMQERLALISCTSLFVLIVTVIMYFGKDILKALNLLGHDLKEATTTIGTAISFDWQLILVMAVTAGCVLYCFVENIQPTQLIRKFLSWLY